MEVAMEVIKAGMEVVLVVMVVAVLLKAELLKLPRLEPGL